MISRLVADADLNVAIVAGVLRQSPAIDFMLANQVPLEGVKDPAVLAWAAQAGRVVVSHDVNTMPAHFRNFVRQRSSPGLVLIPQDLSIGNAVDSLLLICHACKPSELQNRVWLVPNLFSFGF